MTIDAVFTTLPILTTERFILRPLRSDDVEALFAIFSDAEVMKYYGSLRHTLLEDTRAFLVQVQERYARREALRWGITVQGGDDRVIGTCSLHRFGAQYRRVETGYDLNRAYWGKGIVPEAMHTVLNYAFSELGVQRVEAIIDDANARSKSVLLKLGFTYEGCLRQRYLLGDEMVDEFYFGVLRDEWLGSR